MLHSGFLLAALFTLSLEGQATEPARPCREIHLACIRGGYKPAPRPIGSSRLLECKSRVLAGETLEGVKVGKEIVASCRAKKKAQSEKIQKRKKKKSGKAN